MDSHNLAAALLSHTKLVRRNIRVLVISSKQRVLVSIERVSKAVRQVEEACYAGSRNVSLDFLSVKRQGCSRMGVSLSIMQISNVFVLVSIQLKVVVQFFQL